ncbi:MAG: ATP-binding cassette domain-containing protein, partial [Chitinophagales bacterium]
LEEPNVTPPEASRRSTSIRTALSGRVSSNSPLACESLPHETPLPIFTGNGSIGTYVYPDSNSPRVLELTFENGVEEHADTIIKITAAILFILGPIEAILNAIPSLAIANNGTKNILDLEKELDFALQKTQHTHTSIIQEKEKPISFKKNIHLQGLMYKYEHNNAEYAFFIGPMNLKINKGEIVFITGGNGAGKSTFLKMFTGLYKPQRGSISIDKDIESGEQGILINNSNYHQYSELFATIFTDFHLFDKLYGIEDIEAEKVRKLLLKMGLPESKTAYRNGGFTNIKLSSGQKKRLALITCILEDKEIFIFDEVAADLDPEFRDTYYFEILAELKSRNKTVLVVSHDKTYWHVADRVLRLEKGQFCETLGMS